MGELYTNNDVNQNTTTEKARIDYGKTLSTMCRFVLTFEGIGCFIYAVVALDYTEGLSLLIGGIAFGVCMLFYCLCQAIAQIATNSHKIIDIFSDSQGEIIQYTKQERNILLDIKREIQYKK